MAGVEDDLFSLYYGEVSSRNEVSLHFGEGEMTAVTGANGTDKKVHPRYVFGPEYVVIVASL